jgi:transcription termination factor NusB
VTTIKVEIKEQKGGMAISMEMGGSENPSQSEMMFAIVVRSKIEEALKSITSDNDEGNFLRFLMSVMSKNEDKEGEEHPASPDWVMEELEKIEKALCKEGKE